MLKANVVWKWHPTIFPNIFFSSLLNSYCAKDLKIIPAVKTGNDVRYPYWFWKVTLQYLLTESYSVELKGGNLIRMSIRLKKCIILSKGIWPLIPPDKRANIFNYSTLKTHEKMLVLPTVIWTRKPVRWTVLPNYWRVLAVLCLRSFLSSSCY